MKMRRAAMKEYFRAANIIATDITNSCHRICTLAHASTPVNPTATTLSGSGSINRSIHFKFNLGRPFPFPPGFSFSSPLLLLMLLPFNPFDCFCFISLLLDKSSAFSPLLPPFPLSAAKTKNLAKSYLIDL